MTIFERRESQVRSYCRTFDAVFDRAIGSTMYDENGRAYIDFFAGAGSLNYGHNHPLLKQALLDYLNGDHVVHTLDLYTRAKRTFLERFESVILKPRCMDYRVMFTGPTGTNAVEAALKLARKVTGRKGVVAFTNSFHGMTLGSLAVTGNRMKRAGAGLPLNHADSAPFDGYFGQDVDTLDQLQQVLDDGSAGWDLPAAFIVETVQGEGGVNVAQDTWLQRLAQIAKDRGILLIVDDIQVGCGRTGPFFSFESAGIEPDLVTLSKSLSGFGLPMAITLIRPELDIWEPGEHNGTFRGHNPAFVTAAASLAFWETDQLSQKVTTDGAHISARLDQMMAQSDGLISDVRGRGMIWGMEFKKPDLAANVSRMAFEQGLIIETSGAESQVLKLLPPLTINRDTLDLGLRIIESCLASLLVSPMLTASTGGHS
ncbi:MAG: diaminobutyrate--2-oxoglutarate transaminase [Acidobacteria bacterium]|nr:diaminobutyrate--2-oxoglutarate transaminase [Acidobacteriota bacterium]